MRFSLAPMFSLWLTPPPQGDVCQKLQNTIRHFSQKYETPLFPPHVTLVGDAGSDQKRAIEAARIVGRSRKSVFLKFQDVSYKEEPYFQCVFLLCAKTDDLLHCRGEVMKALGCEDLDYMPHVSLLYANIDKDERQAVVREAVDRFYNGIEGMEDELLSETGFWADAIEVWKVDVQDKQLKTWECVEKITLEHS